MSRYAATPSRRHIAIRTAVRGAFWVTALMVGFILAHLPASLVP